MSENFYTPPENISKERLTLLGDECKHIVKVLRKNIGDELTVVDGIGNEYNVEIEKIGKNEIYCKILNKSENKNESKIDITLGCALIKGERFDWLVEKVTEIGVKKIIPMLTERVLIKNAKVERWRKISISAMKQSKRGYLPIIEDLQNFEDIIRKSSHYELKIIAHEKENTKTINNLSGSKIQSSILLIGPEGGFTDEEIEFANKSNFEIISFGKTRLRTETAGVVGVSLLVNCFG
jgi:16S rRNA (uracil1498-N3)-methyltransferase